MKIGAKFSLFTGSVVLVTTATMAALAFFLQKNLIEKSLADARLAQLNGFSAACRQGMTVNNELFLVNQARLIQEFPGIRYGYFADTNGKILVHTDKAFYYKTLKDWQRPDGTLEIAQPVAIENTPVGKAVLGFSREHQAMALRAALARTMRRVAGATLAVAAAGLAAAFLFGHWLTKPIRALAAGSEEIGKGRFATEVRVDAKDELGGLAERFNAMARRLGALDEMKDAFIASVSHQLRSPLAAIKMSADFMLKEDKDRDKLLEKQKTFLVTIIDNAVRLNVFVSNILDAAKIKAGRMDFIAKPVDVAKAADNIEALYGVVMADKNIRFKRDVPPGLPAALADPQHFDHILSNLLSNAIKFTDVGGEITLGARARNGAVEVWVADTGKGIAPEDLPKIFSGFYQADPEGQRAKGVKGTGLGLSIVKQTAERMGGRLDVTSTPGAGSRFAVTLPKAPA